MAFGDFTVTRSTTKRVLNSAGVLSQVAINTPAFEFNADGTYRGTLIEPGATNLMIQSQNIELSLSSQSNTTVVANSTVAPDGTTTADTLSFTNTNGFRLRSFSIASGTTYTASIFYKNDTYAAGETLRLNISDGVVGSTVAIITPFTNSVTSTGNTAWTNRTATIQAFPNGWYRVTVSGTAGNSGTGWFEIANSTVTGKNIFIWGLQFEIGPVATSYIPTVASTANRTADSVTLTGASSLIGQTSGTIYAEVIPIKTAVQSTIICLTDNNGTNLSNRYELSIRDVGTRRFQVISGLTTQADINPAGDVSGATWKIACAYAVNDFAMYYNGSSVGTDTSGILPVGTIERIFIGNRQDSTTPLLGHIRSVALFPSRLANATLETLTTP